MGRAAFAFVVLVLSLCGAHAADPSYIGPADIDLTTLLAPAPAPDSAITREDVRVLLDLQAVRTPEMVAMANADVPRTLSRFSEVTGTDLSPARAPVANAVFDKVGSDAAAIMALAKNHWKRTRPYLAFPEVKVAVPPEATFSYPSGHAAFGMETAILLAQMLPEKAEALFARGIQFGFERAIAGVHYPSDVEAGRQAGIAIIAVMMNSPKFQTDFAAARTELRGLLGLPELPQVAAPPLAPALPAASPAPAR
ncbi:acid phosphatase [Aquabacter cavernae]|uniref:acid phosphatase n=1 Tax=Aquabacter cavernae TaxID=2496029 RepID=UPI000F8CB58A|nr:phosphatase PAP2 family protein [Aquabacter cavernae]